MQGLHPDIVARLPQWQFAAAKYFVRLDAGPQPADRLAALQAVLQQLGPVLRALHAADVCWHGSHWHTAMVDALASAKAGLPHLSFSVRVWSLSDDFIAPLLRMGSATLKIVSANDIADIGTHQHAEAVWPWGELDIRELDVALLAKFPRPAPGKTLTIGAWERVSCTSMIERVSTQPCALVCM